jgi:ribose 5-phosphate isomerase B
MKIAFGSDHAGFDYKEMLMARAREMGHETIDLGTHTKESCDYPVYGHAVAAAVKAGEADRGVLVCGTGFGISLAANRVKGIRCVNASDELTVSMARRHNDANMLSVGERIVGRDKAVSLLETFLETDFDGGRHARRVNLIDTFEED